MKNYNEKISFNSVEGDSVLYHYKRFNLDNEVVLELGGKIKYKESMADWFSTIENGNYYGFNVGTDLDVLSIRNRIEKDFKKKVKDYLSEYCVKARKNESDVTIERMLIDHRCIAVKGKEYYIPRDSHDGVEGIIRDYLYDNFQL